jgi:hypothetical protein
LCPGRGRITKTNKAKRPIPPGRHTIRFTLKYTLQESFRVAGGNWTTSGYTITTSNSLNSITITPPVGNLSSVWLNPKRWKQRV